MPLLLCSNFLFLRFEHEAKVIDTVVAGVVHFGVEGDGAAVEVGDCG